MMDVSGLNKRLGMFLKGFELPPLESIPTLTPEELSGVISSLGKAMSSANNRAIQVATQKEATLKQLCDLQSQLKADCGVDSLEGLEELLQAELAKFEGLYAELDSFLSVNV